MNSQREAFEKANPPPANVWWSGERGRYVGVADNHLTTERYQGRWEGWQAAAEQGVREPVAWSFCPECGCGESHVKDKTLRICSECGQDWHTHIDYMDVVRSNLLRAHPPKPTGGGVPEGLIEFAKRMLAASRDGCGVDGADIQEWALECGLIDPYQATESCGPDCVCAEVADFPIECYRDSALLATQQPKD